MEVVKDLVDWIKDLGKTNIEAVEDNEAFFFTGMFLKVYRCGWIDKDAGIRWKKPLPGVIIIHADDIDEFIIEAVEEWIDIVGCNLPENEWYEVEIIRDKIPKIILLL